MYGNCCYCSHVTIPRGVFTRFLRENPEFNSAKLRFLQFLCIAERVAVNGVNSNKLLYWRTLGEHTKTGTASVYLPFDFLF